MLSTAILLVAIGVVVLGIYTASLFVEVHDLKRANRYMDHDLTEFEEQLRELQISRMKLYQNDGNLRKGAR